MKVYIFKNLFLSYFLSVEMWKNLPSEQSAINGYTSGCRKCYEVRERGPANQFI